MNNNSNSFPKSSLVKKVNQNDINNSGISQNLNNINTNNDCSDNKNIAKVNK